MTDFFISTTILKCKLHVKIITKQKMKISQPFKTTTVNDYDIIHLHALYEIQFCQTKDKQQTSSCNFLQRSWHFEKNHGNMRQTYCIMIFYQYSTVTS